MDTNAFQWVITVFVAICAIAFCMQAGFLYRVYQTTKAIQDKLDPLIPKVEAMLPKVEALVPKVELLVDSTRNTIDQSRQQIVEITTKANQILESTRSQLAMVEDVVADATSRARVQMDRAEIVLDDAMNRAQEAVAVVHSGIMRPLREINGIALGIKTAFAYLSRGNRPSVAQATSDEEMFI